MKGKGREEKKLFTSLKIVINEVETLTGFSFLSQKVTSLWKGFWMMFLW
jgi:hypothetical protein